MTDRPANTNEQGGQEFFKTQEERERLYAPEEVPGGVEVPEEVDQGGTAASGTGVASLGEYEEEETEGEGEPDRGEER